VATNDEAIFRHLGEAQELAGTAAVNILGQTGEARICELGILHGLIALCLLIQQGQGQGFRAADLYREPRVVRS
jgi:hypothetical protein